jgi:hypothetical protein
MQAHEMLRSPMGEFAPERILEVLAKHDVAYVMIGGLAAAIHGSDLVTGDMDITPSLGHENLARLSSALDQLEARIRSDDVADGLPFSHDARSLAAAGVWNLVTKFGDLDISFVPSGTQGYADLSRDAVALEILGSRTTVASLEDIIRSKEAAGRPKDVVAVPMLRRLLSEIQRRKQK